MQHSDNYQLIKGILNNQPVSWPENQTDKDATKFIDCAQQHGVLALLNEYRQQLKKDNWPALILQSIAIANKASQQILEQRKKAVTAAFSVFEKSNIDALIFKGAANAYLLYPQPQHRTHADIDILIRETDFQAVKNGLGTLEFEFDSINPTKFGPFQSSAVINEAGKAPINFDIHWKINNRLALANVLEFDELMQRAIAIEDYGNKIKAFSYRDAVLAACIHEAGCLEVEKSKLISIYDVHLLLQKMDDQALETLATTARDKKIGQVLHQYLTKCLNTFDDPRLAERISKVLGKYEFQKNELSAKLLNDNLSWAGNQWLDFRSVNGHLAKLEFILSKLKRKL